MKRFVIPLFLLTFTHCNLTVAQPAMSFLHEFKKGKSILLYSYTQRRDSTFLTGHLQARGSRQPVLNVNIIVKGFPIGTVPDIHGTFMIFLPAKEGVIIFDKTNDAYFEFPYKYKKEELKQPFSHH
jgi:hypothetical protein